MTSLPPSWISWPRPNAEETSFLPPIPLAHTNRLHLAWLTKSRKQSEMGPTSEMTSLRIATSLGLGSTSSRNNPSPLLREDRLKDATGSWWTPSYSTDSSFKTCSLYWTSTNLTQITDSSSKLRTSLQNKSMSSFQIWTWSRWWHRSVRCSTRLTKWISSIWVASSSTPQSW